MFYRPNPSTKELLCLNVTTVFQAVTDYRRALEIDENFQRAKEGLATAQKRQKQVQIQP
jgi:hypothetical protein